MPVYESPLLNIGLPPAKVIPGSYLLGLYTCLLGTDYLLLRHQLPLSKRIIRTSIVAVHAAVPLYVISPLQANNVAFAAVPWFLASYSAYLPTEHLGWKEWIKALSSTVIDSSGPAKPSESGWKVIRGVAKLAALLLLVDRLLPANPKLIFQDPYFSLPSLLNTFLFGVKAYLILGTSDILAGIVELVSGKRIVDLFDAPFLATSPRDFWSHRWNKPVRNLLHAQVFKNHTSASSSKTGRGLLAFAVSGIFHELIIWSLFRKATFENLSFFLLHGFACMLETRYVSSTKPKGWKRVGCILSQLGFMTLTGRLFLAPFLRSDFTQQLPLRY